MSDNNLIHVIPPYLLNTCLGLELQRELFWANLELGAKNAFVSSPSCHFRQPKNLPRKQDAFCEDKSVNDALKEKLREKFAVAGILGDSPPQKISEEYLFELYEIFKSRLRTEGPKSRADTKETPENGILALAVASSMAPHTDALPKKKQSVFEFPNLGEFRFGPEVIKEIANSRGVSPEGLKNMVASLSELMRLARDNNGHKYSFLPYLMVNNQRTFLSPLPMYWTLLSIDKQLEQLDVLYGMSVSLENGYSILEFKLNKLDFNFEDTMRRKRYYNFIANNEVDDRTGVFYYEVLVEQKSTPATNHRPILLANDSSLSSGSSLLFSVGFTKRHVRYDTMPSTSGSTTTTESIDLKDIQNEIAFYNQEAYTSNLDDDTLTFLGAEPGISFEGSFALSFNNSCSYASIKNGDNSYRTSSLNMNRRFSQLNRQAANELDTSRLDVEVPFTTHAKPSMQGNKILCTDTVGCGVNFINKTLFITLNGILVKTISHNEIINTNRHKDSIFVSSSKPVSLFPMIGFQLSDVPATIGEGDLPESKIITNFGQREFLFNINHYVKEFKSEQETELNSTIAEELRNLTLASSIVTGLPEESFEKSVKNFKDDPTLLNDFIKGYLVQEGYLDTLESFKDDLTDLAENTSYKANGDVLANDLQNNKDAESLIKESDAVNRHTLRTLIFEGEFKKAADFLQENYPKLALMKRCIFDLQVMHYVHLLKRFIDVKVGNEFVFGDGGANETQKLFTEAFEYGRNLLNNPEARSLKQALSELSGVLLVHEKEDLAELTNAKKYLDNFGRELGELANRVNLAILELKNFHSESRLENMIHSVGRNISTLCADNDDPFKMINYEKDYIDI